MHTEFQSEDLKRRDHLKESRRRKDDSKIFLEISAVRMCGVKFNYFMIESKGGFLLAW
jgi:hypothetical protein